MWNTLSLSKRVRKQCLMLLSIWSLAVFSGCSVTVPKIPVKGLMMGELIETTVDSEIARYYLENYLQNQSPQVEFDKKINTFNQKYANRLLNREDLKQLSVLTSVDFAALFWAERLYQNEKNRRLQDLFQEKLSALRTTGFAALVIPNTDCCILLFVPAWDYAETGVMTGSDLSRPIRIANNLGIESVFVAINPHGSVEENAVFIRQTIQSYATSKKDIILVGPSSAGPAIHLSLAHQLPPEIQKSVKAWINLAGILQGTPLVDHYQKWFRAWFLQLALWWEGLEKEKILSMSMEKSRLRFEGLSLPQDLLVINYIGLSLSGDITPFAAERYAMLRSEGPNDGLTLLPDSLAPGSRNILALRSDHFFNEDPEIVLKTIALMEVLFEILASEEK